MNASWAGTRVLAVLLILSCTHHKAAPDGGGGQQQPPVFINPAGPAPEVFLRVNGTETTIGSPIIFTISIHHPLDVDARLDGTILTPLILAAQTGGWAQFVTLVVRDQSGAVQSWPVHVLQTPTGALSLDQVTLGKLILFLTPEDSARLTSGTYDLDVWVDTRNASTPASWKGVANSNGSLTLNPAPANPSPLQQCLQAGQLADYYDQIKNDPATAITTLDKSIATQPNQGWCLLKRASLAERGGDVCTAYGSYAQVLVMDDALASDAGIQEASWIPVKLSELHRLWPDGGCPGI